MAGRKKAVEETTTIVVNPLELRVTKNVVGILETNIEQLEKYVTDKLEEYKPELYQGDADSAKKDRAELNNSKKFLSQTRINLMRELMKPYEDFETRCKALEKKIDTASGLLDVIVKNKEEQEKTAKRMQVQEIWLAKNFTLFPLEKIFNQKWLNKSYKLGDISSECDAIISKTYSDLQTIEEFEDSETLKAHYLMTLDIAETISYGKELARQKEIAEREAKEREQREHDAKLAQQKEEQREEAIALHKKERMASLVAEASETKVAKPVVNDYVIKVQATEKDFLAIQYALNNMGVLFSYEKLDF